MGVGALISVDGGLHQVLFAVQCFDPLEGLKAVGSLLCLWKNALGAAYEVFHGEHGVLSDLPGHGFEPFTGGGHDLLGAEADDDGIGLKTGGIGVRCLPRAQAMIGHGLKTPRPPNLLDPQNAVSIQRIHA